MGRDGEDKEPTGKLIDASKKFKKPQYPAPPNHQKQVDDIMKDLAASLKFIGDTVTQLVEAHEDTRQRTMSNSNFIKWIIQALVRVRILKPEQNPLN